MSVAAEAASVASKAAKTATKNGKKHLPIGKDGIRYQSASRLTTKLMKTREIRHMLRENQERFEERKAIKAKKIEIMKEARQIDAFPFPRQKEEKKVLDYPSEYKRLFVHPGSVDITPQDVFEVTAETLPRLSLRATSMREEGHSWATVTTILLKEYTSQLQNPIEAAMKRGLVKRELKKVWEKEKGNIQSAPEEESPEEFDIEIERKDIFTGDWSSQSTNTPHPESIINLKDHMVTAKTEKL